jgi:hypothetical protein
MFGIRLRYSLPTTLFTLTILFYGYYQAWAG